MASAQEKAMQASTLACILPALRNKRTTVELRNEGYVSGKIVEGDGFMNITMVDVTFTDPRGARLHFETFFVQNRLIRYIQVPQSVDLRNAFVSAQSVQGAGGGGRGRGRGEVSRHRAKILDAREQRRAEDLKNALKFKEEWKRDREEKDRREEKHQ